VNGDPRSPQVACFDTALHGDLPPIYRRFALPTEFEARGVRRYGFHGLSFDYIARQLPRRDLRTVVAHLGSGCSLCAIRNGKSVNATMSLTPLDGLMMQTRSGAIDPGLLLYLQQSEGMSAADAENLLYHKAGLFGKSGVSGDMLELLASDKAQAKEAIDQFCARIAEQIAVMAMSMNGMDMLVSPAVSVRTIVRFAAIRHRRRDRVSSEAVAAGASCSTRRWTLNGRSSGCSARRRGSDDDEISHRGRDYRAA
jgi:acetate kinase